MPCSVCSPLPETPLECGTVSLEEALNGAGSSIVFSVVLQATEGSQVSLASVFEGRNGQLWEGILVGKCASRGGGNRMDLCRGHVYSLSGTEK